MARHEPHDAVAGSGRHLLLYDGPCGLCNRLIQVVLPLDRHRLFDFASLQSPAARAAMTPFGDLPGELESFVVIPNYRTGASSPLTKSAATFFVVSALGWPWRAAVLLRVLPAAWLDWLYDGVARRRYLFGRREHCFMPRPEHAGRFLDASPTAPPR